MVQRSPFLLSLCLVVVFSQVLSFDLTHIHHLRRRADDDRNDDKDDSDKQPSSASGLGNKDRDDSNSQRPPHAGGPRFSMNEFGEHLRDILDRDRPERRDRDDNPWERGRGGGFTSLLSSLEDLAERAPDDISEFDSDAVFGQVKNQAPKQSALNNSCLKNPNSLRAFLTELNGAMTELRKDLMENVRDAVEEVTDEVHDAVKDDDQPGDTNDDSHEATDVTGSDGATMSPPVTQGTDSDESGDDDELDSLDMEDVLEKLSEASMECMIPFLDDDEEKSLCQQLSHQSARVFSSFLHAGVDCSKFLDRDDDLDEAHQRALLNQLLRQKPASSWTTQDLQRAAMLVPDVFDDDLLDDISDDVLDDTLDLLGRLAGRPGASPGLQLALRQRIAAQNLGKLNSTTLSRVGKGLLTLSDRELDELDPEALLNADLDDIFDDDDDDDDDDDNDSREKPDDDRVKDDGDDDDDDDDEKDGKRLALGRRMKQAQLTGSRHVGRVARFLYDDLDFLESVEPDDLLEGIEELTGVELDEDDAANIFRRMSQSSAFPQLSQFSRQDVQRMRMVMPGMSLSQIQQLPSSTIREALDDLKDLDFGESQSRKILEELFDEKPSQLTVSQLRSVGHLARGLAAEDIEDMDDNLISELLDDLDDTDLNDAQTRILAAKALNAGSHPGAAKLLTLARFAEALSISDIEDSTDDDVLISLNVSTAFNWRASQASSLVHKVKQTLAGRSLRPADIPNLGTLARGLLPSDLDDIVDRPDDVDDLADVLGDLEDDLSSSLLDKMVELIEKRNDMDDLPKIEVTAAFVAQKGVFLAYLPKELFDKLEFDDGGKKALVSLLGGMDTSKLPRPQLKFLAEELLDMMEDKVGEDRDDSDFRKLRQLGSLALGLSEDRLKALSAQAVLRNLGMLGTLPLTRDQAETVLDKLEEALPDWECKSSVLANVGPLLQFASKDTIDDLCDKELVSSMAVIEKRMEKWQEHLEERWDEGLWREDSLSAPDTPDFPDNPLEDAADKLLGDATEDVSGKKLLVAHMLSAAMRASRAGSAATGRQRRATGDTLTCSVLRLLRQDVVMADVGAVVGMADTEFWDCLEVLGNATKWPRKDLTTLMAHAVQVIGATTDWSNEVIRQAGVLTAALSPAQMLTLQLTGVDAMNSMARHVRLSQEQLRAGFSRWLELKKNSSVAQVSPGEFAAMSEFVCGLTEAQIGQLPLDVLRRSLDVVGSAVSCSVEQRSAYASLSLKAFGDIVRHWAPAVVGDMGHIIAGLSSPSVQQLTVDQLALIRPAVIANLPPATVKALTDSQLRQLSTNQVNSLSRAQYDALSAEQKSIVDAKATVKFSTTTTDKPGAGSAVSWSLASLLAALLISMLLR